MGEFAASDSHHFQGKQLLMISSGARKVTINNVKAKAQGARAK